MCRDFGARELAHAFQGIVACRFEAVEAHLSGFEAANLLRGSPLDPRASVLKALLALCRGRFEEAHRQLSRVPAGLAWPVRALTAWATFDRGVLDRLRSQLVHRHRFRGPARHEGAFFERLGVLLSASVSGDPVHVRRAVAMTGSVRDGPPACRTPGTDWRSRLDRLLRAEVWSSVGDRDAALRALGPDEDWRQHATPLEQWFATWLRASTQADRVGAFRGAAPRELSRTRSPGVRRLGLGSHAMHLLHVVPDLLDRVNEADDELAALTNAWQWTVRHCEATAVGFLEIAGGLIAGSPGVPTILTADERRELAASEGVRVQARPDGVVVTAPVRYAGVRIGVIVIVGSAGREATLTEAASSVAALCAPALRSRLDAIAVRHEVHARTPEILGRSPAMTALREAIARAASSPFPVLVEGESGSGKELVARAIHRLSPRRDRRFAALNCAALSDELAETELFGHARGAFTGAIGPRAGLFEEAHLGTLFLDEAAELSARSQARLLRALQEREVRRLGENAPRAVDVRVVAASNRPLAQLVTEGRFREDLLFRLAVVRIAVPPLRERPEDVSLLALACWRRMASELSLRALLGPDALAQLARHTWPGNVRELQNVMAALAVSAPARGRVSARHVEQVLAYACRPGAAPIRSLDRARADCERHTVAAALARHGGRRASAARELGLTRQGLAKAMKRLRIDGPPEEPPVAGVA